MTPPRVNYTHSPDLLEANAGELTTFRPDTKNISNMIKVPLAAEKRKATGKRHRCRRVHRAAGAGGRYKPPQCPETASQTAESRSACRSAPQCAWPAGGVSAPRCVGRGARCGPGKRSDEGGKKAKRVPELPNGGLVSTATDSCFPLIYLQQSRRRQRGERVGVVPYEERSLLLRSPASLSAAPSTGTCSSAHGVRGAQTDRALSLSITAALILCAQVHKYNPVMPLLC